MAVIHQAVFLLLRAQSRIYSQITISRTLTPQLRKCCWSKTVEQGADCLFLFMCRATITSGIIDQSPHLFEDTKSQSHGNHKERYLCYCSVHINRAYPTQQANIADSKFHGATMGPIWGRQDPGGPHVGPVNFVIWDMTYIRCHATST